METLLGHEYKNRFDQSDVARKEFVQLVNNVAVTSAAGLHEAALWFHPDVEPVGASVVHEVVR
jgi:hypothetical protein